MIKEIKKKNNWNYEHEHTKLFKITQNCIYEINQMKITNFYTKFYSKKLNEGILEYSKNLI